MKFLGKIKNYFYRVVYSLPFAMKGGEIMSPSKEGLDGLGFGVEKHIEDERLSKAMLKGEVTKEVVDMRYRDYKVSEESRSYNYLGDGVAIKGKGIKKFEGKIKFGMPNEQICSDTYSELKRVDTDEYLETKYTINVVYDDITRFKIEKYCTSFNISLGYGKEDYLLLKFPKEPYFRKPDTKAFINEIKKCIKDTRSNGIFDLVSIVSFVTYKVTEEKNYVSYILQDLHCEYIKESEDEFVAKYKIGKYVREDLIAKFKVDELDEKYKNKEAKVQKNSIDEISNEKYTCDCCGCEVNKWIAEASIEANGKVLCEKCWQEMLTLSEK